MTFVLVVLAAGAVLAGFLGLPALWTRPRRRSSSTGSSRRSRPRSRFAETAARAGVAVPGPRRRRRRGRLVLRPARSTRTPGATVPAALKAALRSAPGPSSTTSTTWTSSTTAVVVRPSRRLRARSSPGSTARVIDGLVNLAGDVTPASSPASTAPSTSTSWTARSTWSRARTIAGRPLAAPRPDRPHPDLPLRRARRRARGGPPQLPHPASEQEHAGHVLTDERPQLGHLHPAHRRRADRASWSPCRFLAGLPKRVARPGRRAASRSSPAASRSSPPSPPGAGTSPARPAGRAARRSTSSGSAPSTSSTSSASTGSPSRWSCSPASSPSSPPSPRCPGGGRKDAEMAGMIDDGHGRRRTTRTSRCGWCPATWSCCSSCRPA